MKSILDRAFQYRPSFATDVRKTFERIRREKEASAQEKIVRIHGPRKPQSREPGKPA
jgi:hypothetical protein